MNETYFTTLDLTNTCEKELQYPGVNSTTDSALVDGFPNYTEWFYVIPPMATYNMTWQLTLHETIPNGTDITLTFEAAILSCSDEDESQYHYCPTSKLSHTFPVNNISNTTNATNEPNQAENNTDEPSEPENNTGNPNETENNTDGTNQPAPVLGCTDAAATNFDPTATENDDSCEYLLEPNFGCTNNTAINYDAEATQDDGTCQYDTEPIGECGDVLCDACPAGWITLPASEGECCPVCQNPGENNQINGTDLDNESEVISDSENKSSFTDFVRNGLAVAVFCSLVVLLFNAMRKP